MCLGSPSGPKLPKKLIIKPPNLLRWRNSGFPIWASRVLSRITTSGQRTTGASGGILLSFNKIPFGLVFILTPLSLTLFSFSFFIVGGHSQPYTYIHVYFGENLLNHIIPLLCPEPQNNIKCEKLLPKHNSLVITFLNPVNVTGSFSLIARLNEDQTRQLHHRTRPAIYKHTKDTSLTRLPQHLVDTSQGRLPSVTAP